MEILKTINLTKRYGSNVVVSDLNMTIQKRDIYGFIGKNGAGKTTTIKMIVGLSQPTSGSVTLFEEKFLNKGRKKVGAVIESPAFVPNLNAKQNMLIQWNLVDGKDKSEVDDLLNLVGLSGVGKKKVKKFSLGMKQRLGIAMALLGDPEFLILDEPTNGLDPEGIVEIRELILKLNREKNVTVLISSHILEELVKLVTRIGIIHQGKLIDEFNIEELNERCKSKLILSVDDTKKALNILKEQLNLENLKEVDENTVEIYDMSVKSGVVNSVLAKNDIIVNSISRIQADLEEYFLSIVEGGKV